MKEVEKLEKEIVAKFENLELSENESKSILCITCKFDRKTNIRTVSHISIGEKIDIVNAVIFLLRKNTELEIQHIFEAVKESI